MNRAQKIAGNALLVVMWILTAVILVQTARMLWQMF